MTWTTLEGSMTVGSGGQPRWLPPPLEAARRGELEVHYQPLVEAATGEIAAFEALLRWEDPVHGRVAPDRFAPWIEEGPDAASVDRWIMGEACAAACAWPGRVGVAINIHPRRLGSPTFVRQVAAALDSSGLDGHRLSFELVERAPVLSHPSVTSTLRDLQAMGVGVVLDDFLVHYSSLGALAETEVAAVKVDRSFVAPLNHGARSPIVEAVVRLAHDLGIAVVAEGIETVCAEVEARRLGCELLQGFRYSPAVPREQAGALVEAFAIAAGARREG